MKHIAFLLAALGLSIGLTFAQQSETRPVGSFSGIKTGEAIDVYLKKGDKESVRVEVSGDRIENVLTEVVGSNLKIHLRENSFFRSNVNVKVYVTYVSLNRIYASSASNVFSEGILKTDDLEIQGSSAADIELAIEARDVRVHASSAADIILEGKAKSINAEASSSGEIDAYALQVESADASASSAGSIKLSVSETLEAGASSGGSVRYRGNPTRTNTHSSSGGSVKKAN
ncbi:MAG: DUF2807 domain-containing protein [Cyclobacteriaceae bacterium]|nr:DUF2807 domain-containing protein [Cyclobacteriaceae bacterium]